MEVDEGVTYADKKDANLTVQIFLKLPSPTNYSLTL